MSDTHGDGTAGVHGTADGGRPEPVAPSDPDELRQEIERTREQLGETVDQLAAKVDVKQKAQDKAAELRTQMQARATALASRAGQLATQAQGAGRAPQPPLPIVMGAAAGGVLLFGYLIIRRRRSATGLAGPARFPVTGRGGAPGTRRPAGRWAGSATGCRAGRRSQGFRSRSRRIAAW
jgi:ElaB/YqjD/DUF883 family membrane-anchored ribosome-binding protein